MVLTVEAPTDRDAVRHPQARCFERLAGHAAGLLHQRLVAGGVAELDQAVQECLVLQGLGVLVELDDFGAQVVDL